MYVCNQAAAESNMVFVEYFGEGSPLMKNGDPVPFIHGTYIINACIYSLTSTAILHVSLQ